MLHINSFKNGTDVRDRVKTGGRAGQGLSCGRDKYIIYADLNNLNNQCKSVCADGGDGGGVGGERQSRSSASSDTNGRCMALDLSCNQVKTSLGSKGRGVDPYNRNSRNSPGIGEAD